MNRVLTYSSKLGPLAQLVHSVLTYWLEVKVLLSINLKHLHNENFSVN